jgi:hypothetical protein
MCERGYRRTPKTRTKLGSPPVREARLVCHVSLHDLARLLGRQAAREVLAAGNRGGRDSEASRAPTESVVRPSGTPKFEQETGA